MPRSLLLIVGWVLLLPLPAWAQEDGATVVEDAGATGDSAVTTPDAAPGDAAGGCGALTLAGECDGTTLRYCYEGEVRQVDCATLTGHCGLVDCTDPATCWGYDCVAHEGEACSYFDYLLCEDGLGCVDGTCAATPACGESYTISCAGDVIQFCPFHTNVYGIDCTEAGTQPYVCAIDSLGEAACLGVLGAYCNVSQGRECTPGFECRDSLCSTESDDPDAGTSNGDDDDDASDENGCGCSALGAGGSAALLLLGLAGLAMRRRR